MNKKTKWLLLPVITTIAVTLLFFVSYTRLIKGQDQSQFHLTAQQIKQNSQRPANQTSPTILAKQITTATTGDLIQARTNLPSLVTTAGIGELLIPQLKLTLPVFATPTMATLSAGVARYFPTRPLLTAGNQVLIAHNFDGADVLLRRIDQLQKNAMLYLTDKQTVNQYRVQQNLVVDQSQVAVLRNTTRQQLTLIRCEGGAGTRKRRVVVAELVQQTPVTTGQPFWKQLAVRSRPVTSPITTTSNHLVVPVSRAVFTPSGLLLLIGAVLVSWVLGLIGYFK